MLSVDFCFLFDSVRQCMCTQLSALCLNNYCALCEDAADCIRYIPTQRYVFETGTVASRISVRASSVTSAVGLQKWKNYYVPNSRDVENIFPYWTWNNSHISLRLRVSLVFDSQSQWSIGTCNIIGLYSVRCAPPSHSTLRQIGKILFSPRLRLGVESGSLYIDIRPFYSSRHVVNPMISLQTAIASVPSITDHVS